MTGHASVHIDAMFPAAPLFCQQPDGRLSVTLALAPIMVWLSGTPDELRAFAVELAERVDTYEASHEPAAVTS